MYSRQKKKRHFKHLNILPTCGESVLLLLTKAECRRFRVPVHCCLQGRHSKKPSRQSTNMEVLVNVLKKGLLYSCRLKMYCRKNQQKEAVRNNSFYWLTNTCCKADSFPSQALLFLLHSSSFFVQLIIQTCLTMRDYVLASFLLSYNSSYVRPSMLLTQLSFAIARLPQENQQESM